jgi:hypothetical protein
VHGAMKSVRLAAEEGRPPLFHFHPDPPARSRDQPDRPSTFPLPYPLLARIRQPGRRPQPKSLLTHKRQDAQTKPRTTNHGSPVTDDSLFRYGPPFLVCPSGHILRSQLCLQAVTSIFRLQTSNLTLAPPSGILALERRVVLLQQMRGPAGRRPDRCAEAQMNWTAANVPRLRHK